jgi:D-glycero-alpha-D-manno-heptose-7-phosphate kinase
LDDFGALLDIAWRSKKKLSPKVTTQHIDEMYELAKQHGALGGKITGAGGGGYLMLYCDYHKKHKVASALQRIGGRAVEFEFEGHGLQTWSVDKGPPRQPVVSTFEWPSAIA